jgi:hypothetical protein
MTLGTLGKQPSYEEPNAIPKRDYESERRQAERRTPEDQNTIAQRGVSLSFDTPVGEAKVRAPLALIDKLIDKAVPLLGLLVLVLIFFSVNGHSKASDEADVNAEAKAAQRHEALVRQLAEGAFATREQAKATQDQTKAILTLICVIAQGESARKDQIYNPNSQCRSANPLIRGQ